MQHKSYDNLPSNNIQVMRLSQIADLKKENAELKIQVEVLAEKIEKLQAAIFQK